MRSFLVIIMLAIAGTVSGWLYSLSANVKINNTQCYILLKNNYQSEQGDEYLDSTITFSFLSNQGTTVANFSLITTDNKMVSLTQRMAFDYAVSQNDEYTLTINKILNSNLQGQIPENTSFYIKNILNTYLIKPQEIKIRIRKGKNGDYIMYNNVIPWVYCNRIK